MVAQRERVDAAGALCRRRSASPPRPRKPTPSIAQVAGSGTALLTTVRSRTEPLHRQASPDSAEQAAPSRDKPLRPPKSAPSDPRRSKASPAARWKPLARSMPRPPSSVVVSVTLSARQQEIQFARSRLVEIAGDRDRRRDHQGIVVVHGPRDDLVAERRVAAGEGQVAVADRDRAPSPEAESLAGPGVNGRVRLVVDLDIPDDPAAVRARPDRGIGAGAVDRVARDARRQRRLQRSRRCWRALRSSRNSTRPRRLLRLERERSRRRPRFRP
jgi:hypothetical protein